MIKLWETNIFCTFAFFNSNCFIFIFVPFKHCKYQKCLNRGSEMNLNLKQYYIHERNAILVYPVYLPREDQELLGIFLCEQKWL